MDNTLDIHNEQLNRIDSGLDKMDDDLNQVNDDLNYLNKSSFLKSLFCCFGFRKKKKCSPFNYLISKLKRNKTANNIPYIVINEDKDEQQIEENSPKIIEIELSKDTKVFNAAKSNTSNSLIYLIDSVNTTPLDLSLNKTNSDYLSLRWYFGDGYY
jgi:ABC-type Fe3+-citrate transport system substrate-binding protein